MSSFIIKHILNERIIILNNELLTKEVVLEIENRKEDIRLSNIEDIKYFFDESIDKDKSLQFVCNGNVVEYLCNYCIYCQLSIKIGHSENRDENIGDTKYYKIMEYGECNNDLELLKCRKYLATSDDI